MSWWYLLLGALPLIVYALIEWKWGLKAGVLAAIFIGILEFILTYFLLGIFDPTIMFALVLLSLLGSISIVSKKPIFFLLQPAFLGFGFAVILFYFQYWDTPLMIKYLDRMQHVPELADHMKLLATPEMRMVLTKVCNDLIYVCLIHAILMVIVAFKCNRVVWLVARVPGFWFLVIGSMLLRFYVSRDSLAPIQ